MAGTRKPPRRRRPTLAARVERLETMLRGLDDVLAKHIRSTRCEFNDCMRHGRAV